MRASLFHFSICDPTKRFSPTCRRQGFASRTTSPLVPSTAFTPSLKHTTLTTATMIIFKVRDARLRGAATPHRPLLPQALPWPAAMEARFYPATLC
jgi:hypothetical protein